jgi:hypothetical protein
MYDENGALLYDGEWKDDRLLAHYYRQAKRDFYVSIVWVFRQSAISVLSIFLGFQAGAIFMLSVVWVSRKTRSL